MREVQVSIALVRDSGTSDGGIGVVSGRVGRLAVVSAVRWLVLGLFALYAVLSAVGEWLIGSGAAPSVAYKGFLAAAVACAYALLCQQCTHTIASNLKLDLLLVAMDVVAVTVAVLFTGGYESPLRGLYAVVVLEAVVLFEDRTRLWGPVALVCMVFALATAGQVGFGAEGSRLRQAAVSGAFSWFWVTAATLGVTFFGARVRRRVERERKRLHELVVRDGLTGLYNRRFFLHRLNSEVERCRRYGRTVSLLLIDIDHFKAVNDSHGHQTGDEVLAQVGETFRNNIRCGQADETYDVDVACRYGGEEFAIIVPEAEVEVGDATGSSHVAGSLILAERLRAAVAALARGPVRVTVSIGVASFPRHADNAAELVEVADKALYEAKHAGRNRVAYAAGSREKAQFTMLKAEKRA